MISSTSTSGAEAPAVMPRLAIEPKRDQSMSSAPEVLVEEIIDAFAARYEIDVETVSTAEESVFFPLPRDLRPDAAE